MKSLTPEHARIFRITHFRNCDWIFQNGIHCRNSSTIDHSFVEIGSADLIQKRKPRLVPHPPGGALSDYIPFYFTSFSPMLLNIKTGWNGIQKRPMDDIVILVTSLPRLVELQIPFVFSDRHAYLNTVNFSSSLQDLQNLDWTILQNRDFERDPNDPEKMDRYMAEALVHQYLPVKALLGVMCFSPKREDELNALLEHRGLKIRAVAKPDWYFQ